MTIVTPGIIFREENLLLVSHSSSFMTLSPLTTPEMEFLSTIAIDFNPNSIALSTYSSGWLAPSRKLKLDVMQSSEYDN